MNHRLPIGRRAFVCGTAPLFLPASVFGRKAPSNRITVGVIGVGRQTVTVNLKQFLAMPDVQVVAVCDVDAWRLANARQQVEESYARQTGAGVYKGCRTFRDSNELLADKSIDAAFIGAPDHWHVPLSVAAIQAGKDVSCEKPLTRFIAEGRQLSDLAAKHKRVFRNDSEFRSLENFHRAVELVRNGRIGKLHTIRSGVPGTDVGCPPQPDMPVPDGLDYERWQGPAPRAPYTEKRVHPPKSYDRPGWMRHTYYCDGMVTNWGAHLNDIVQWGNNTERTGPVEVEARGAFPPAGSFWNVMLTFEAEYRYANGVRLYYKTDSPYVRFEGAEGWILAEYNKPLLASPAAILDSKIREDEIRFPFKSDKQDFIDAVKTRGQTLEDAEVGHRTMSVNHLANIAVKVGERLQWDPAKERFTNSETANAFVKKAILHPGRG
ncbi:MAG TPA: Gfo/Idh/MocA family oxidoreductase [Bryobacteraceae bacterium]|nr:Gfo/Idh/MocA family oxidoreductase [Bryobacteraceae bacterium]